MSLISVWAEADGWHWTARSSRTWEIKAQGVAANKRDARHEAMMALGGEHD